MEDKLVWNLEFYSVGSVMVNRLSLLTTGRFSPCKGGVLAAYKCLVELKRYRGTLINAVDWEKHSGKKVILPFHL